jgi:hypothetical protein
VAVINSDNNINNNAFHTEAEEDETSGAGTYWSSGNKAVIAGMRKALTG